MRKKAAVIAKLEEALGDADEVLDELWHMMMKRSHGQFDEERDARRESELEDRLAARLSILGEQFPIALEMLRLPRTQKAFIRRWTKYTESELGKTDEWHNDYGDGVESEPLAFCRQIFQMVAAPHDAAVGELGAIEVLEFVLASTARILKERGVVPARELDVQDPMHAHLDGTFKGFLKNPTISKSILSFIPDCGIGPLSAAIEFKFVDSDKDLKSAIHGLSEDVVGYSGSLDWTRFFSVIYQTQPFETQERCRETLERSGKADKWRLFLVTGAGSRRPKAKRSV